MRKYRLLIVASLALIASPALADWTGKNAAGATITFSNPVDCTSGTCIPIAALVNASGATLYGTAGSSNAAVLSVQGIASGTALPISGTVTATPTGTQAVSIASGQVASGSFSSGAFASGSYASGAFATGSMVDLLTVIGSKAGGTAAASSMLAGCAYNTSAPTLTNGQQAAVQCDVNGNPKVSVVNTNANGQAVMASSSPVVIASNQSAVPVTMTSTTITGTVAATQSGTWTVQPGNTANTTAWLVTGTGGTFPSTQSGTWTVQPGNTANTTPWLTRPSDGTRNAVVHPCEAAIQSYAPISITTATTTRIVAPSASNKTYICSLLLTSAAADNVGIVEGTGGTCGSGTAGVIGGTTAANGPNFAANGGLFIQAGGKVSVAQTAGTNVDLCLITSAATPLAGGINYVQAP